MCPHITFLEWVRRRSNQYTRHFERRWPLERKQCQIEDVDLRVQATPKPARPGVSYYREYHRGWNVSTTDQQYKRALANLKSPNMLVVWLETLDHGGWRMLEDYLNASGVVPWISTARRKSGGVCASGSLSACATNMTVHANMNANRRRRRGTQGGHHYDPTDAERAEAVRINHHDVALHAALTKGLNLETSVPTPTPTRSSGSGSGSTNSMPVPQSPPAVIDIATAAAAWAWVPDPDKEYVIENVKYSTPLVANGNLNKPGQGDSGEISMDSRWMFTPVPGDPEYYFIDRAAGGSKARLQVGNEVAMMRPSSKTVEWVRFSLTDAENGEFFLDSKAGPKRGSKRIDFKGDGSVGFIQTNKGGLSKKFRISLADAANIANDKPWKDTEGNEIKAGKGGQLTKIDGTWYWIGTDPNNAGHLHLYSSETLGDGTWKWRGQVAEVENGRAANCKLAKHPNNYYIIVCKGQVFFKSDTVDGWYDSTNPQNVQKYVKRPTFANGEPIEGLYTHKFGGGSLFIDDDGESAYYITSRKNLEVEKAQKVNPNVYKDDRNVGIYKLNEEWTDYEEENAEVYWNSNIGREAMFLFKRNNRYYMTASHTGGWKPSDTYIKTATRQDFLDGQWGPEKQLEFVPAKIHNDKSVKSHGCQQRYLVDLGDDRWMFGGDRYPVEGYDVWYPKYGRHIRMPVVWRNETVVWSDDKVPMPTVYWRSVWNVGAYDYTNTKSEKHDPVPGVNDCPTKCFHLHL